MKINQDNYEAYFLDFVEGKLNDTTLKELELFLESNPHLKKELESYCGTPLFAEEINFPHKENLYKLEFSNTPVTIENFVNYCIAFHENLLDEKKKNELLAFLKQNKKYEEEFRLFSKVYLTPDFKLSYPVKANLYRKGMVQNIPVKKIALWGSVAASLAMGLFLLFSNKNTHNPIAQKPNIQQTLPKQTIIDVDANSALVMKSNNRPITNNTIKNAVIPTVDSNLVNVNKPDEPTLEPLLAVSIKSIDRNDDIIALVNPDKVITIDTLTQQQIQQNNQWVTAESEEEARKKGLLAIAESGINKLNQLTGSNFELSRKTDPSGKINSFSLNTGLFGFYRKRNRVE